MNKMRNDHKRKCQTHLFSWWFATLFSCPSMIVIFSTHEAIVIYTLCSKKMILLSSKFSVPAIVPNSNGLLWNENVRNTETDEKRSKFIEKQKNFVFMIVEVIGNAFDSRLTSHCNLYRFFHLSFSYYYLVIFLLHAVREDSKIGKINKYRRRMKAKCEHDVAKSIFSFFFLLKLIIL